MQGAIQLGLTGDAARGEVSPAAVERDAEIGIPLARDRGHQIGGGAETGRVYLKVRELAPEASSEQRSRALADRLGGTEIRDGGNGGGVGSRVHAHSKLRPFGLPSSVESGTSALPK